jgi:hypothetical protein
MSVGTVLVATALVVAVVAYIARPFRAAPDAVDPDAAIEFWVAQIREEHKAALDTGGPSGLGPDADKINYCPECGRRVTFGDRFCSGCGTRLRGGEP